MQRKNIIYRISYVLMLIFFILGAVFYRQPFLALIVLLLFVLPFISIILLKMYAKKIIIKPSAHSSSVTIGHDIYSTIDVINNSHIPFLNIELEYSYNNLYHQGNTPRVMALYISGRNQLQYKLTLNTSKCGMVVIEYHRYVITDFLHLYSIPFQMDTQIHIPVLPERQLYNDKLTFPESYSEDENATSSTSGQLSRDIKDMREYIPGDLLRDIHWKVSARKDDLFVKLYEQSAVRMLYIVPELTTDLIEDTMTTLVSLCEYLVFQRESFKILAFSIMDKSFSEMEIKTSEDIDNALLKLYYLTSYDMKTSASANFSNLYGSDREFISICGKEVSVR